MSGFVINPYAFGVAAPFSPDDVAGLTLWLDADDATTITESAGAVSQWDDKSGNANHVSQGTASFQPTTGTRTQNSRNVLDFDRDFLDSVSAASTWKFLHDGTEHHIFIVASPGDIANPDTVYAFLSTGAPASLSHGASVYYDDRASQSLNEAIVHIVTRNASGTDYTIQNNANNLWTPQTWGILDVDADPDNGTAASRSAIALDDGTAVANNSKTFAPSTADPTATLRVGGLTYATTLNFTGGLAELLIYNGTVTSGERASILTFLSDRWGITI